MKLVFSSIFFIFVLSSCSSLNKVLKSNDIDYKYKKGIEYFKSKKYSNVIQLFDDRFFPLLKGTDKFEEAFYMLAYSHFYEKDYFNAENLFRQFSETFSTSNRAIEMEYMRAFTYYKQSPKVDLEQTNTIKTIAMMNQFIAKYPESKKSEEALVIVEKCQEKLEAKDYKAAELYFNMGQFKAASVAFGNLLNTFPESNKGDQYKFMAIKAFYQYALLSIDEKKEERFEQVITNCNDFLDKFPESKLTKDIERYSLNSTTNIKNLKK